MPAITALVSAGSETGSGVVGRGTGVFLHHFDIGTVSVSVIFVICVRISCQQGQSYASPAIMRFVMGLLPHGAGATGSRGPQGAGMARDSRRSVGWEAW